MLGAREVSLPTAAFRSAVASDAQALAAYAERSFRETFEPDNKPEDMDQYCRKAFGPDVQERELLDPDVVTVLAISEGVIAGYGQIRLRSAAEIRRLYVDRTWQGKRLAHELLQKLIEAATGSGAEFIWLGVWERNARAIRFYEKVGFTVTGEHDFALGNDIQRDLVMKMVLVSSAATA